MLTDPFAQEKRKVIDHLKSGWEIYLIEDKPYPAPHKAVLILGNERQEISYNAFASLAGQGALKPKGSTFLDGRYAEVFIGNGEIDQVTGY